MPHGYGQIIPSIHELFLMSTLGNVQTYIECALVEGWYGLSAWELQSKPILFRADTLYMHYRDYLSGQLAC